ncbi:hypothetical protein F2P81_023458 [Scophthalmus maximus]|uniref:Uncharacterized protein n=1 Tax=Scophthalmus maximus TaxID=52904 RepID=A0A6A4RPW3_SCOMX|nr:hypothetical protein F2P81_023458 [Scophthalmus maximus]
MAKSCFLEPSNAAIYIDIKTGSAVFLNLLYNVYNSCTKSFGDLRSCGSEPRGLSFKPTAQLEGHADECTLNLLQDSRNFTLNLVSGSSMFETRGFISSSFLLSNLLLIHVYVVVLLPDNVPTSSTYSLQRN